MKFQLLSSRSGLLSYHLDNIIYRHEIGMDSFGRIRRNSPIVQAHVLMLALLAGLIFLFGAEGLRAGFYGASGIVGMLSMAAYPLAFRRAFNSIRREKLAGTLEQLYLTMLTRSELFEGKFFGSLAPFFEVRRYVTLFCLWSVISAYFLYSWWEVALVCWAAVFALNHFGYSVYLGVLGGMNAGSKESSMTWSMIKDWRLNPYLNHVRLTLSSNAKILGLICLILFLTIIPTSLNFLLSFTAASNVILLIVGGLMLFLPLTTASALREHVDEERSRLSISLKRLFNFESVPS